MKREEFMERKKAAEASRLSKKTQQKLVDYNESFLSDFMPEIDA
jgi:hypothetical protein